MLGILATLLVSWLLLGRSRRKLVSVLGIAPNARRLTECLVGMLFMAIVAVVNFTWQAHFKEITYETNRAFGVVQAFWGSFWILKGVVFEELLFRGAILYLLIKRLGLIKACLLSSLIFGVYHWYSYEVFGSRFVLMIYILLITGCGGWMFAIAFGRTRSLYAPIGLHFGWNVVTAVVFSSGPLGDQWLLQQGEAVEWSEWVTLLFFSLQAIVAPGIVTWFLLCVYRPPQPVPAES